MQKILIFNDKGSDEQCVHELKNCFESIYENKIEIKLINADYILNGSLNNQVENILCIGGGFDLGYLECLGQNGCQEIRNFVEAGGYYIGICAGAYFASEFIEFDLNGELEVLGERILKFFPGKAIGPLNNFKYNDNDNSSIAAKIKLLENGLNAFVYLNGGCYFEPWSDVCNKTKVIATYEHNLNSLTCRNKIAVVECLVGKGKCLLSGVHFEFDARHLDSTNENVRSNILEKLLEANETTFSILSSDKNDKNHSNQKLVQYLLRTTFNI